MTITVQIARESGGLNNKAMKQFEVSFRIFKFDNLEDARKARQILEKNGFKPRFGEEKTSPEITVLQGDQINPAFISWEKTCDEE